MLDVIAVLTNGNEKHDIQTDTSTLYSSKVRVQ